MPSEEQRRCAASFVRSTAALYPTKGSKILFRQLHEEPVAATPTPAISLDTADEALAVVVDFDEPMIAVRASRHVAFMLHGVADI